MMMIKRTYVCRAILAAGLALGAVDGWAQQEEPSEGQPPSADNPPQRARATALPQEQREPLMQFGGSLYVQGRYMQNANRTPTDASQIDEAQAEYGANIFGNIDRELVTLVADYDFAQHDFYEDTQEDRFIRTGSSALTLGNEKTFYQLDASHSTQRFLRDPASPTILANTDQRDITTVTPLLRLRPGQINSIALVGTYADVRYKLTDLNDSERVGYGVQLRRETSPVHTLGLEYVENDVDYAIGEAGDYTYRRATFTFEGNLRQFDYSLQVGVNEADPEFGEKVDGTFFDLSASHTGYDSSWTLSLHQSITDTSLGNSNDPFFSQGWTSDVAATVQDQLERRSFGVGWQSALLCARCEVDLRAGYEDESYFNTPVEDRDEVFVASGFGYRLTPSATAQLVIDHRRRSFAETGRFNDHAETSGLIGLELDPIFRHFETQFWLEYEYRNPDEGSSYSTSAIGTSLVYNF